MTPALRAKKRSHLTRCASVRADFVMTKPYKFDAIYADEVVVIVAPIVLRVGVSAPVLV